MLKAIISASHDTYCSRPSTRDIAVTFILWAESCNLFFFFFCLPKQAATSRASDMLALRRHERRYLVKADAHAHIDLVLNQLLPPDVARRVEPNIPEDAAPIFILNDTPFHTWQSKLWKLREKFGQEELSLRAFRPCFATSRQRSLTRACT